MFRQALASVWEVVYEVCMMFRGAARGTRNLTDYYEETTRSFVEDERANRQAKLAASKPKPGPKAKPKPTTP